MLFQLMLLFILVPLIELAILVYLGLLIGPWYTIIIVVATGIIGAYMARNQGMATLAKIRGSVERGVMPSRELFEGLLVLIGGLMLLTPGIITDIIGFLLLVPQTRRPISWWLRRWIRRRLEKGDIVYHDISLDK